MYDKAEAKKTCLSYREPRISEALEVTWWWVVQGSTAAGSPTIIATRKLSSPYRISGDLGSSQAWWKFEPFRVIIWPSGLAILLWGKIWAISCLCNVGLRFTQRLFCKENVNDRGRLADTNYLGEAWKRVRKFLKPRTLLNQPPNTETRGDTHTL